MVDHPCKGMTKAQIAAFERIAVNEPHRATNRTLAALLTEGLVESQERIIPGSRPWLNICVTDYRVPTIPHMQWCRWASENVRDDEIGSDAAGGRSVAE